MVEHVEKIFNSIKNTAIACGRNPETIKLIAVSKTVSADRIKHAIQSGITSLGENYIQEAVEKIEALSSESVAWHFIGHLQSNKAREAVKRFDVIHTVDRLKLAKTLNREARKINKIQKILIQVNIGRETTKSGIPAEEAESLVEAVSHLDNLLIQGLMALPPYFDDPERVRPCFRALRELRDRIRSKNIPRVHMDELSMGMSGDYPVAIEEGATLVRIGTAIFGRRY